MRCNCGSRSFGVDGEIIYCTVCGLRIDPKSKLGRAILKQWKEA